MFVGQGTLDYGYIKTLKALEPERYRTLRRAVASYMELPETQEALDKDEFKYTYGGGLIDERMVQAFTDVGIKVTLDNVRGLTPGMRDDVHNTIYQICIPDIGVMQIRNVDYLYNADCREVNDWLDKGWRIMCICPPRIGPQRGGERPDEHPTYVMGDTKSPQDRP